MFFIFDTNYCLLLYFLDEEKEILYTILYNGNGKTQKDWYHTCQSFQMELSIPMDQSANNLISSGIETTTYVLTSGRRSRFYSYALVRMDKRLHTGPAFFRGEAPLEFVWVITEPNIYIYFLLFLIYCFLSYVLLEVK